VGYMHATALGSGRPFMTRRRHRVLRALLHVYARHYVGTARRPSIVGSDANSTDTVAEAAVRLVGLAGMIICGRDSNINMGALATKNCQLPIERAVLEADERAPLERAASGV
jgi:hypothetical protein